MAQKHLDRLTATDASFLHQEGTSSHMHIGALLVFEGPVPAFDDYLEHVRGRLHLVPRYRQKLAMPPLDAGNPRWIDDPNFNLEYHIRHAALPAPGTETQLHRLTARIASNRLDRARPLWESWMVEGLEPAEGSDQDRFALIFKTHHALVDGVSGVDLATVLFDATPDPAPGLASLEPWRPRPEPSPAELLATTLLGAVEGGAGLMARAIAATVQPSRSISAVRDAVEGVGEIVWAALNPAPETPLNVPIGPHRRFAVVRQQLSDYKTVKNTFGGTVNDVVLTVVSGALAGWLRSRGIRTEGVEMRALVPVSVRSQDERHTLGNRLTAMRGPLPVYIDNAVMRLAVVREAMDGLKESKQAVGAATIAAVNNLAPPTILAQASRLQFSTRLFNLLVTNIPGPQLPLYVLGRPLEDIYPIAFLPQNHALAVAIMSYNGRIEYGLLGDFDALPDIDLIADGIESSLQELLVAADEERSDRAPATVRELRPAASRPAAARPPAVPPRHVAEGTGNGHDPSPDATTSILPSARRRSSSGPAADMRAKRARTPPPKSAGPLSPKSPGAPPPKSPGAPPPKSAGPLSPKSPGAPPPKSSGPPPPRSR